MKFKQHITESVSSPKFAVGQDTSDYVRAALQKGGYVLGPNEIKSASFQGMSKTGNSYLGISNAGKEVHKIIFLNDETLRYEEGLVYVDQNGVGDF